MKYIKQEGLRDCGVCSLYNIIRYYGGNINTERLREMTNTTKDGTSIYNIVKTANSIGFISKSYRCNIEDLHTITLPAMLLIRIDNYNHFVILKDIDNEKVRIFDPIRGELVYNYSKFLEEWQKIVITFDKNKQLPKEFDLYNNYIFCLIKENSKKIITVIVLSFVSSLFSLFLTIFIKSVFDNKTHGKFAISFFILVLIKSIIDYIKTMITINLDSKIDYSISSKIYNKIISLPLHYHHTRPVGDLVSKINDIYSIENFISIITLSSLLDIFSIIIILFTSIFINYKFFLIILCVTFFYIILYYYKRNDERNRIRLVRLKNANNNSYFTESLLGIDTINNLNVEEKVINKQENLKKEYLKENKEFISFISLENLLFNFIESYGIFIVMFIGSFLLSRKKISIGNLSMIYYLFIMYMDSLKNLIVLDKSYLESKTSFKNLYNLFKTQPHPIYTKNVKEIDSIKFRNISYSYNNNKIITKLNLDINKGEHMLIQGKSGTGKSTLIKLLNKELELKEGNIYINDEDINELNTTSLRNKICYVSQNEYLFNDSIKNNITMFKNTKNKEIEKVLKVTMLDKVLKQRNINLDFILEENGHNLSAGERQKILLARTLLRNTDFIILDETMNEIDIDSERKILERIVTEYNKTIIMISHRNSNIDLFKRRVEL